MQIRDIKRITTSIALLAALLVCEALYAVPAKPGKISVKQADGTTIEVIVSGDEFFNWRSTKSGYPITMGDDGNYYYAEFLASGERKATSRRVSINGKTQAPPIGVTTQSAAKVAASAGAARRAARMSDERSSNIATRSTNSSSGFPAEGKVRSAVILVEYKDVKFSVADPHKAFTDQLNQEGYSTSGATGSARDYFAANSKGKFDGQFDVYGPYTLSQNRKYYGGNDKAGNDLKPNDMVAEGVALADAAGVDFSIYDYDEDGFIDNVFVYFAGHNEAEGASEECVWPHKWLVKSQPEFDGKKLYVYACTSELTGSKGTTIAGIGTFCHEFSHVFGLYDHYDTSGEDDGEGWGVGCYDIMSYGSYNNNGNTPPLHNALELYMIGWSTPFILETSQEVTQQPLPKGDTYMIPTEVENEFFLLETRDKESTVWENYIAADGLLIYHVDLSDDHIDKWYDNAPNGDTSHECFKLIVSGGSKFTYETEDRAPYPYRGNNEWSATSTPAALSWAGAHLGIELSNITKKSDGSVTFTVTAISKFSGSVSDSDGNGIAGATVSIYPIDTEDSEQQSMQTTTDDNGDFGFDSSMGSYLIEISYPFYDDICETITLSKDDNIKKFVMAKSVSNIDGLEVAAAQSYANLEWNPQGHISFKVTINDSNTITVDDSKCRLNGLTPNTTYSVTVSYKSGNEYIDIYTETFTTMEQKTDIPLIFLPEYQYSAGEIIELNILNSAQNGETITWSVDEIELPTSKLLLTTGTHTIQATVKRTGGTYTVQKIINVE